MRSLTLAYRDDPHVEIVVARSHCANGEDHRCSVVAVFDFDGDYEAALFNGASQAIANTYEIATIEYPAAKRLNPLTLWDLHWSKA